MNLLMTIVFENGFQEIYLPGVDNKTSPIDIRPHISGWKEDITLPLEVWDGVWQFSSSRQFQITEKERPIEKVKLAPGMLLNCELWGSDMVFSITVDEVVSGNTQFGKYLFDQAKTPCVSIGSAESNCVRYANQFCSPRHAEIVFEGGKAIVRDLGSVNGTFVNGRLLAGERGLRYGDVVYIIGLKLVYLGSVLAVNNPKDACSVNEKLLPPINIEASGMEDAGDSDDSEAQESYFMRAPRKLEALDTEAFSIERCPQRNAQRRQPMIFTVGPAVTMMVPMVAGAMMAGGEGASIVNGLVMTVGAAGLGAMWGVLNTRYQKKEEAELEAARARSYTDYVTHVAGEVHGRMERNRALLSHMLPSSAEAVSFALNASPRLWEKSAAHEDFLTVRLGLGDVPSPNEVAVAKGQMTEAHDPLNDKIDELREATSTLSNVPVGLSLLDNRAVGLVSAERGKALELCRSVSAQIAGLHPYTDVRLCFVYPMREADAWDYVRWLPHVWTPDGKLRMVANDKNSIGDVMFHLSSVIRERLEAREDADEARRRLPHYVIVVGDWALLEDEPVAKYLTNPPPELGISTVFVVDAADKLPSGCAAIARCDNGAQGFYSTLGAFPAREQVRYDEAGDMDAFARRLSGVRVRENNVSTAVPDLLSFLDMYKTSRVEELDMLHKWLENRTYESMKSLVGYKSGNQPLYLDIHEKYHGPHGLVAGTTGSGKSETLQSYILSLVVNYHPHEVAFILIDYKGGGMAQSFVGLPHLSGVITNLGGNATNRALLSINAEIKSRQRIFNEYKVKHIDAYIELYRSGAATEPMPHLLIIADEFAELKKEQPEFVRALVSAARVGRSLGVNLILATQKPSGVVDDEIWSNTRFRLCLRVADKQDSNEMLKRPDAAFITGTGRGFFQVGNDEIFEEFQSGWSGAEYEPDIPFTDDKNTKVELINLIGRSGVPKQKKQKKSDNIAKVTQLDAVVRYAAQIAQENNIPPIKQIWLPPLPSHLYLIDLAVDEKPAGFSLRLPVGLCDNPETQSQYACYADFLADGHLLLCGGGGSGKTTLLQTLIYGAATRYSPKEVNLYIADFSSRTMAVFSALPHVGGVLFEGDDDKIEEVFGLLQKELARRKSAFSDLGIGSFREYVTQRDDCPAILFIIDNYVAFIESYDRYEDALAQLSREAASYGIYLVLSMNNSGELRSRIRQNFTLGIALQMPDKYEYEAVVGDRTEIVPEGRTPGRGLIKAPTPLEFQAALCIREEGGLSQAQALRKQLADMEIAEGSARKLGDAIEGISLLALTARPDVKALPENMVALGLNAEDGTIYAVDLDGEFCYTVSGAPGSGKTNLLEAIVRQTGGARRFLFDAPGSDLENRLPFERAAHGDAELFSLLEDVLVPEFGARNAAVNEARDAGKNVREAMAGYARILFFINDMSAFIRAVYSPSMEMSGFVEAAFAKGREHRIVFIAAITPDDWTDMARYEAMRTFAGWRRGIHLGSMFDQQDILRFEMSPADNVRQLSAGVAYAENKAGRMVKVVTPECGQE